MQSWRQVRGDNPTNTKLNKLFDTVGKVDNPFATSYNVFVELT